MDRRPAWLDLEAPSNYVPGLGRGATGFTTRSDIGPARLIVEPGAPGAEGVPPAATTAKKEEPAEREPRGEDFSESNYDEFEGYRGESLFGGTPYDAEDKEADSIWDAVDKRMDLRRKKRREQREQEELEKFRQERPKLQQQFADVKLDLATVTAAEWDAIPEIGDHTLRYKKRAKIAGFTPVPDSVLQKARENNEQFTALDSRQQSNGGFETPVTPGTATDLTQIGAARAQVLGISLSKMSDSVSGQTVVDPKSFLTDLQSVKGVSDADIGDFKKARLLLKSVRQTNPKHAPGWIAAARLEELAGKLASARKIINQGCEICPENEDVWLESARLHTPDNAKIILARAAKSIPKSVKIWIQAAALETDIKAKKRVLRKALEFIPNSAKLWKAAVELEEPEDARIMLTRAVECVPHRVEMWLALAHLETYENARKVLNKAREAIPTDPVIWITAAKLEEAHGNIEAVKTIVKRAVKSLSSHQVVIDREQWIKEAESAEKGKSISTCQAIIRETIGIGVEDEDRKRTWMDDIDSCLSRGAIETARAICAHAITVFPTKKSIWLRVAQLERAHGTKESLEQVLQKAVENCPQSEILWLMSAKEKWQQGDVQGARLILHNAFAANPDSEQIWLAAVKLENENNEQERARSLLRRARERAGTARVWMKSALLERDAGQPDAERALLEEGLAKYPQFPKMWMMRGHLEERLGKIDAARDVYQKGLKSNPNSIPLWICAVNLEEKISASRARSLLEKARLLNPKNADLWLTAIRIERRANNIKMAQTLTAKALQECPTSGILWAESIDMETTGARKQKSVDALKKCDNDPLVIAAVARVFWSDRKLDKARSWLNRAVALNPDIGDTWAYYYKFELQFGTPEQQQDVLKRAIEVEPHHGEKWCRVSKDPLNTRLNTEQILKKVVSSLEDIL